MGDHPEFGDMKTLWKTFKSLIEEMKCVMTPEYLRSFGARIVAWLNLYYHVYSSLDVTLYMHVFATHAVDSIRTHGTLSKFSQQSFEKLNDRITQWYFKATNHHCHEALIQLMNKQNRIEYLEPDCKREPKYVVACGSCGEKGHNKHTCSA